MLEGIKEAVCPLIACSTVLPSACHEVGATWCATGKHQRRGEHDRPDQHLAEDVRLRAVGELDRGKARLQAQFVGAESTNEDLPFGAGIHQLTRSLH